MFHYNYKWTRGSIWITSKYFCDLGKFQKTSVACGKISDFRKWFHRIFQGNQLTLGGLRYFSDFKKFQKTLLTSGDLLSNLRLFRNISKKYSCLRRFRITLADFRYFRDFWRIQWLQKISGYFLDFKSLETISK